MLQLVVQLEAPSLKLSITVGINCPACVSGEVHLAAKSVNDIVSFVHTAMARLQVYYI